MSKSSDYCDHEIVPKRRCRTNMQWVVETRGLTLVDPEKGAVCSLLYPYAAVWDFMVRGHSREHSVRLTSIIAQVDTRTAEKLVNDCLQTWAQAGCIFEEQTRA